MKNKCTRREFIKNTALLAGALCLEVPALSRAEIKGQDISELEKILKKEIEEAYRGFGWDISHNDADSYSNVVFVGDNHYLTQRGGFYNLMIDILEKHMDSIGIENGVAYSKEPIIESYQIIKDVFEKLLGESFIGFNKVLEMDELKKRLIHSKKPIYGLESKELLTKQYTLLMMYSAFAISESLEECEAILRKAHKFTPNLGIPVYNRKMIYEGSFGDYIEQLKYQLAEKTVDDRSVYSAKLLIEKAKKKEFRNTGVIYGAEHLPLMKKCLEDENISYIAITPAKGRRRV